VGAEKGKTRRTPPPTAWACGREGARNPHPPACKGGGGTGDEGGGRHAQPPPPPLRRSFTPSGFLAIKTLFILKKELIAMFPEQGGGAGVPSVNPPQHQSWRTFFDGTSPRGKGPRFQSHRRPTHLRRRSERCPHRRSPPAASPVRQVSTGGQERSILHPQPPWGKGSIEPFIAGPAEGASTSGRDPHLRP
jgi:hypothetical protein